MNQQTSETKRDEIDLNEMNLLWDEYKYRHDLIWRHLIRSTVAVIALITVSYTTNFQADKTIFIFGAVLAAIYTMFNFFVLKSEITLFEKIKKLYW